jgi:hypothetical protein
LSISEASVKASVRSLEVAFLLAVSEKLAKVKGKILNFEETAV